jgi:hypothetical protein
MVSAITAPDAVPERDLFGQWASRWQVIRTSNAYVFRDPKPQFAAAFACKCENPMGTQNQELNLLRLASAPDPNSSLERALERLGADRRKTALEREQQDGLSQKRGRH